MGGPILWGRYESFPQVSDSNKLAKLGDAIAISKSETINHSLTDSLTPELLGFKSIQKCKLEAAEEHH